MKPMRKSLFRLFVLGCIAAFAAPAVCLAGARVEVRLAPVGTTYAPPRLGRNQGWLTIANRDWKPYTVAVTRKGRMSITQGALPSGTVIRSGNSVTFAVDRDTWELLGPSGDGLRCRVREGRTSTISLEPFGFVNGTGLRGISNDGDRVRDEVLFKASEAVVVHRPPVIVHTPPPVIVHRPPVVVNPPHRSPAQRVPDRRPGPDRDQNRVQDRDRDRDQDRDRNRDQDRDQDRDRDRDGPGFIPGFKPR